MRHRPLPRRDVPPDRVHGANAPHHHHPLPPGEAVHYREYAIEHGVPADAVLIETAATNTGQNIEYTRKLLTEQNIIVLVSDRDVTALPAETRVRHLQETLARTRHPVRLTPTRPRRLRPDDQRRRPSHQHARRRHPTHRDLPRTGFRDPPTHARRGTPRLPQPRQSRLQPPASSAN